MKSNTPWTLAALILATVAACSGVWFGWSVTERRELYRKNTNADLQAFRDSVDRQLSLVKNRLEETEKNRSYYAADLKVKTESLRVTRMSLKKARAEGVAANQETTQKLTA